MCGRYFLDTLPELLQTQFKVHKFPVYPARYNIRPSEQIPIVALDPDGQRVAFDARWGLVPSWAKDVKIGYKMINARGETAAEKPAFRSAFKSRRCLIPASGFYEWEPYAGAKRPVVFAPPADQALALAGLWERWRDPGGEMVVSTTIVTCAANDLVAPVHDRMPVLIEAENVEHWLSGSVDEAASLIRPAANDDLIRAPLYEIRQIEPGDDPGVANVIRTVMPEFGAEGPGFAINDPEVDAMCAAYAGERARYFVAVHRGKVLGGAGLAPLEGGPADICELRKMYMLPRLRGFSVGRKFIELCLRTAKEMGYKQMYLETLTGMDQAQKLYLKAGFKPLDQAMGNTGHFACNRFYLKKIR